VALASCAQFPDQLDEGPLLLGALAAEGIDARTAVWSDPGADWAAFDLVVANGAWDHTRRPADFLGWVDTLERSGVRLVNPPAVLRWNLDKHYLRDLGAAGVDVVPTTWVEPPGSAGAPGGGPTPEPPDLPEGEVVVKPAVSGGGHRTARYEPHEHDAARAHVAALLASGLAAMVQPYQPAVDAEGETGMIFLGGAFSHAVHKDPMIRRGAGPRDDLIDNQVVTAGTATAGQLEVARAALAAAERLTGPAAYARVDVVTGAGGRPARLELELLDPMLFFVHHPEGALRFARVLRDVLGAAATN
jgi:glutathione synthase/RimK-type ligase-like ATP-grasp enzyme